MEKNKMKQKTLHLNELDKYECSGCKEKFRLKMTLVHHQKECFFFRMTTSKKSKNILDKLNVIERFKY